MDEAETRGLRRRTRRGRHTRQRRHLAWRGRLVGAVALAVASAGMAGAFGLVGTGARASSDSTTWTLGGANPFPYGFYVGGGDATLEGSVDTTGWAAFGGSIGTAHGTSFTVDGKKVPGFSCPPGVTCDALVAPDVQSGSTFVLGNYGAAVSPTPTGTQGSWTLYNNGSGPVTTASPTSPLDFAAENTYLEALDEELSGLPVTSGASVTYPTTGSSGPTITISVPSTQTGDVVVNLGHALAAIEAGQAAYPASPEWTLAYSVPSSATLIVQLPTQADLSFITSVSATGASRAIFVAAPPSSSATQSITLDGQRGSGGVQWEGSLLAPFGTITGGTQIDGDVIEGTLSNTASCVQTAGVPCVVVPEVHTAPHGFVGTLPQPAPPTFTVVKGYESGGSPTSVASPGTTGEYTITIMGSGIIADPLTVSDNLPSVTWLSYGSPSFTPSAGLSDSAPGGKPCAISAGTMTCTLVPVNGQPIDVASGTVLGSVTIPVTVSASAPATQSATNVATVSYDGSTTPSNQVTVTVPASPTSSGGSSGSGGLPPICLTV
ncbi:hypothetical protein Afer_1776 [Acidimicrobium ferrooxidans DSM 10331]|uniref:Choice-of-anchor A domain-containing protein n=1 Tax=Acidimicrobium ferrooxidans (strain DSM 10331 / JCM 15462 / NBRC 103882 / ICP) TaxID=525909 RepID=C7M142_ACIFD|nr:hypothetical protein [Acidimicrobium ferrooxidans]ACU54690.1 hypothetical protein Afer_1776 [Acidimicrobium ferrooxidans DSM 10331]